MAEDGVAVGVNESAVSFAGSPTGSVSARSRYPEDSGLLVSDAVRGMLGVAT